MGEKKQPWLMKKNCFTGMTHTNSRTKTKDVISFALTCGLTLKSYSRKIF